MQTMSSSKLYKNVNLAPFSEYRRLMLWDRRRKVNEGGGSGWICHNSLDIWRLFIFACYSIYEGYSFQTKFHIMRVYQNYFAWTGPETSKWYKTFISYVKLFVCSFEIILLYNIMLCWFGE